MAIYRVINTAAPTQAQPVPTPKYEMIVNLDGRNYILVFDWLERWGRWTLSVYTERREPLLLGHGLVVNYPVGVRVRDTRFWPGMMQTISTFENNSANIVDPNIINFFIDGDIQLAYRPAGQPFEGDTTS